MTILYKPVLIESTEQAEALPIGTIAHRGAIAAVRVPEQTHVEPWRSAILGWDHRTAIGWTALVPIEAEEETRDHPGIMLPTDPPRHPQQTRLVTPWEEA